MDEVFQELANLDKLVHEPARLSIMTALMACESADFLFLQRLTGLSSGNLSVQISKLEEAGLIVTKKRFIDRRPNTMVSISEKGLKAIRQYWQHMEELRKSAGAYTSK